MRKGSAIGRLKGTAAAFLNVRRRLLASGMSLNRIGLILIGAGLIYLIGSITRQSRLDREDEEAEQSRLVAEKVEQDRLATEKRMKEQQDSERLIREKLQQDKLLAEKLSKDRQAVERWEAAAAVARQSQVQVQTMIDPRQMVLVSTGKKKNRLPPKNAKSLVQQVRDQLGEGASVKILDASGKEIARSE